MKHLWGKEPERSLYLTIRTCTQCGLNKVTDHNGPFAVVYFKRGNVSLGSKTPLCEPVAKETVNADA